MKIDKSELSAIDWAYGCFWREYPFMRMVELKKVKANLAHLFQTVPSHTLAELSALVYSSDTELKVNTLEVIQDLANEIEDINILIKGKR
jgi:hypothetical protein